MEKSTKTNIKRAWHERARDRERLRKRTILSKMIHLNEVVLRARGNVLRSISPLSPPLSPGMEIRRDDLPVSFTITGKSCAARLPVAYIVFIFPFKFNFFRKSNWIPNFRSRKFLFSVFKLKKLMFN